MTAPGGGRDMVTVPWQGSIPCLSFWEIWKFPIRVTVISLRPIAGPMLQAHIKWGSAPDSGERGKYV